MKKVVRTFMLWVVAVAVLIASAGVTLVKHACHTCDVHTVTFFLPGPCCNSSLDLPEESSAQCCSLLSRGDYACTQWMEKGKCCEIETASFFKTQTVLPQTVSIRVEVTVIPQAMFPAGMYSVEILPVNQAFVLKFPPPGRFETTSFLYFTHQLKIPLA